MRNSPLVTALEAAILRDVLDGTRGRSATDENRAEHDAAVGRLIDCGYIIHNPHRKQQKFNLSVTGRAALDVHERVYLKGHAASDAQRLALQKMAGK